jgi:hypothetical protein
LFLPHSMFNFHVTPCPKCRTTPRTISYFPSAPAVVAFCILLISHNILYLSDLLLFRDLFSFAPSHIFYSLRTFFSRFPDLSACILPRVHVFSLSHISILSADYPPYIRSSFSKCTPYSPVLDPSFFLHVPSILILPHPTFIPSYRAAPSLIRPSYFCLILHFAASPYFQIPPPTPPSSSSFPLTFSPSA